MAAVGKMLVHRSASIDAASVLPTWLPWLPLRQCEEDARDALRSLCQMLEADAATVLGGDASRFPMVLGAMAAAFEAEATGEDVSRLLKKHVQQWTHTHAELLQSTAAAIPQPHLREKLGRMVA